MSMFPRLRARWALLLFPFLWSMVAVASEHGGGGGGAPHPAWQYIAFHVINLTILFGIIYFFARRKVKDFLIRRQDALRDAIEQAEQAKREAEEMKREYERRLAELDGEVDALNREVEAKAREEAARIVANAEAMSERVRSDVQRLLDDELSRARHQLRSEAVELAFELAERLLRERIEESDQRRLAEDYLKHVTQSTEIH